MEKTFEIDVPVRVACDQWTQFEEFPRFMEDMHEVEQLDSVHVHWRASVGGKEKGASSGLAGSAAGGGTSQSGATQAVGSRDPSRT